MINMDFNLCGLSCVCGWYRLERARSPDTLYCVLNSHDYNLAWIMDCSCLPELWSVKVCWDHVVKSTLNWNNLDITQLTHYLLRKAKRSTKEIRLALSQKQLDTHLWRTEQYDIMTPLHSKTVKPLTLSWLRLMRLKINQLPSVKQGVLQKQSDIRPDHRPPPSLTCTTSTWLRCLFSGKSQSISIITSVVRALIANDGVESSTGPKKGHVPFTAWLDQRRL